MFWEYSFKWSEDTFKSIKAVSLFPAVTTLCSFCVTCIGHIRTQLCGRRPILHLKINALIMATTNWATILWNSDVTLTPSMLNFHTHTPPTCKYHLMRTSFCIRLNPILQRKHTPEINRHTMDLTSHTSDTNYPIVDMSIPLQRWTCLDMFLCYIQSPGHNRKLRMSTFAGIYKCTPPPHTHILVMNIWLSNLPSWFVPWSFCSDDKISAELLLEDNPDVGVPLLDPESCGR